MNEICYIHTGAKTASGKWVDLVSYSGRAVGAWPRYVAMVDLVYSQVLITIHFH